MFIFGTAGENVEVREPVSGYEDDDVDGSDRFVRRHGRRHRQQAAAARDDDEDNGDHQRRRHRRSAIGWLQAAIRLCDEHGRTASVVDQRRCRRIDLDDGRLRMSLNLAER